MAAAILGGRPEPAEDLETAVGRALGRARSLMPEGGEPRRAQAEMAEAVAGVVARGGAIMVRAGTGTGKALALDTLVPTVKGWSVMGMLESGDEVFDERGEPCRVVDVFPVLHNRPCYELTFGDGARIIADGDHLWPTVTRQLRAEQARWRAAETNPGAKRPSRGERFDSRPLSSAMTAEAASRTALGRAKPADHQAMSTETMAATVVAPDGALNHAVGVAEALCLPEKCLSVDPYLLGVWLGGGTTGTGQVNVGYDDLAEMRALVQDRRPGRTVVHRDDGRAGLTLRDYAGVGEERWSPSFAEKLRLAGVIDEKRIPIAYRRASFAQRLALLQGLLDTDGTVDRHGEVAIALCDKGLIEDVADLVRTLGIRTRIRTGPAAAQADPNTGVRARRETGVGYCCAFSTSLPVFRLPRKLRRHQQANARRGSDEPALRYVHSVVEVPSVPVRCIAVDSPSHLFLVGREMVPTHNSLAYLLPAALSAKRTVVATATHTLQAQLADKDLPLVAAAVGAHLRWAVVKGRQSYLCKAALADAVDAAGLEGPACQDGGGELGRLARWAELSSLGEREELVPPPDAGTWSACSVPGVECPGARNCEWGGGCFAEAARRRARGADIVLATTKLYAAHMLADGRVLSDHEVVVVDECHHFEADLEATFGVSVSAGRARRLLAGAGRAEVVEADELGRLAETIGRFEAALGAEAATSWGESGAGGRLSATLVDLGVAAGRLAEAAELAVGAGVAARGAGRIARGGQRLAEDCLRAGRSGERDVIRYVEAVGTEGGGRRVVRVVPTDLDRICASRLWGRKAVVMCSGDATVTLARRLGLPERAFLELWSPWDWAGRAMLYVPEMPSPRSGEAWEEAVLGATERMVDGAGGRSLVLCTSRRMLGRSARRLAGTGRHRVLVQGEADRGALLKAFRDDEASVLVATRSFFTGVDAPGPTLSLVVVDRIPFPTPNDPLVSAKRERPGSGGFAGVDLATAAVGLNQAVGRLLRRSSDAGLVMVTDPRLVESGYAKKLLSELPPMRLTRDGGVALRFMRAAIAGLV